MNTENERKKLIHEYEIELAYAQKNNKDATHWKAGLRALRSGSPIEPWRY